MTAQALAGGVSVYNAVPETVVTMLISETTVNEDTDPGSLVKLHTVNNTVKFCTDGDDIFGVIKTLENRVVEGIKSVGVAISGGFRTAFVASDAVAVGDKVVAGGATSVKKVALASASAVNRSQVVAKTGTTTGTVDWLLFGFGGGTA